jgi:hypothetical protein
LKLQLKLKFSPLVISLKSLQFQALHENPLCNSPFPQGANFSLTHTKLVTQTTWIPYPTTWHDCELWKKMMAKCYRKKRGRYL